MLNPVIFIVFGALIFLIILFVISKFKILIKYCKKADKNIFSFRISALWGLLKFENELSLSDKSTFGIENLGKLLKNFRKKSQADRQDPKKTFKKYKSASGTIERLLITKQAIVIEQIRLLIMIGRKDAAETGILSGVIWALLGNIDAFISNNFKVEDKYFCVNPVFLEEVLEIDFLCIISTRIVHIIRGELIFWARKIKKKFNKRR